jgi:hypothetical protein
MKIYEKISAIKAIIKEIKKIDQNSNKNFDSATKIRKLNNEINRLKDGIHQNVEELEKILEEYNARS